MPVVVVVALAFITSIAALFRAWWDHKQLKQTIFTLEHKARELSRVMRLRGQLAGEIAHEIKNPITAIQSSAETLDLMLGDRLEPELRQSLHYMRDYSDYLLRLLSDFLEVSRCEAGTVQPKPEVFAVAESIEAVAALLRAYAVKKHVSLLATGLDHDTRAWADERHVKQILFNLVHNALKFTPERGTVEISIACVQHDRFVSIAVSDTGAGIPQEDQACIFNPYARYEGNQPAHDAGVGLGLALCRKLVELAGGEIFVTSTPGAGSTFTFTLPKAPVVMPVRTQPEVRHEIEPALFQPLLGQNYLVVDESPDARNAIAELIRAWGGMVDLAGEAIEAVEAVASKNYDAVMVDNSIDGVNCYELASIIREHVQEHGTTIILATNTPPDEELAHECGADRTIEKPLHGERLLQSLLSAGKCQITH